MQYNPKERLVAARMQLKVKTETNWVVDATMTYWNHNYDEKRNENNG